MVCTRLRAALGLFVLAASGCASRGPAVEPGSFASETASVLIEPGGGCGGGPSVRAWGPTWATEGAAPAEVEADEHGGVWLSFPMQTGLGQGQASLHVLGEVAVLPLGARSGEHELRLKRAPWPSAEEIERRDEAARATVAAEAEAWSLGHFLLQDQGQPVGEIQLQGDRAVVSVFDAVWLTPEPQPAQLQPDGPDLVLTFAVEPSFQGESGVLRLNVPTRSAVVPADVDPTEIDRQLTLALGELSAESRAAAVGEAMRRADALEAEATGALAQKLASAAHTLDGECRGLAQLDPSWGLLLAGYDVEIAPTGETCEVRVRPRVSQQGRRLKARFGPEGQR